MAFLMLSRDLDPTTFSSGSFYSDIVRGAKAYNKTLVLGWYHVYFMG